MRNAFIASKAKEKKSTREAVLAEMRNFAKSRIESPEKVLHFHRTSLSNFEKILAHGALLSRSEIKKGDPEAKLPGWSASDDCMMTRDVFDKQGILIKRGLTRHGVGASGSGATLVLGPSIMAVENYDAIMQYPTVSDAPIKEICTAILVETEADKKRVETLLSDTSLSNIPVRMQDAWERQHYQE